MRRKKGDDEIDGRWWKALQYEECPITLELLSTLPYPPFSLKTGETVSYFDGLALASYVVSRGVFQNPLTRQELTMDDCRRLDNYLELYCYESQQQSRKVSVAEAFGLRNSIHIEQQRNNNNNNEQQSRDRAQALRNAATAALAGLFVYGNNRPSSHGSQTPTESALPQISDEDQLILDWGFDLSRTLDEDTSEYNAGEGWTVIDDDEELVVTTQREAYQTTQASFPRLDGRTTSNDDSNRSSAPQTDEYMLTKIRGLALDEQKKEELKLKRLEEVRKRLLQEALRRREERKEENRKRRAEGAKKWQKQKQDEEETQRARAEIEAWRDEQWDKLLKVSEARKDRDAIRQNKEAEAHNLEHKSTVDSPKETTQSKGGPSDEEIAAQNKKAKAAAKRKRAKERKKAQKAEERANLEQRQKEQSLAAKKAASSVQCDCCGTGILGSSFFEKFGQKFCSTKCARTATPKR